MKWCVQFPEEEILIVRPCLVAICMGSRPAAKLLSVLLYRYSIRQEHKEDAENLNELKTSKGEAPDQDTTFRIYRRQTQLVKDMCGEIVEKTLHDVAVPTLQILGYLDVDESSSVHCYDIHLDRVVQALEVYKKTPKQLEKFLMDNLQLEKFLITREQLEKFLINQKKFQLPLEKVLIVNRNFSNNKRGPKPSPEAERKGKKSSPKNLRDNNRDYSESNSALSDDTRTPSPSLQQFFTPTEECMCMYCQRVYKNSEIAATPGDLAPCGHDKNALFDVANNPQVNGGEDGTHNRHDSSRTVGSNDDDVTGNPQSSLEDPHRTVPAQQQTTNSTEKPQLNRLISPPEPLTQQIVDADESHRRIASESDENTPSSPVVNAATDEVIHTDTRNDGTSYSPQSTSQPPTQETTAQPEAAETPEQNAAEEKPKRRRTRRTRKVPPPFEVPEELKPRVEKVYAFLNKWRQLKLNDPEECFERDAESDESVCSLFNGKPPTEKRLEVLCERIWNEKRNPNTGYLPREHMTVKTICKQYKAQSMSLAADEKQAKGIVSTVSQIAGYTMKPDLDDEEVVYLRKEQKTPRKRA